MQDSRSDLELISAVNRGDHRAFEALYHRYRDWVYALAFRFTGHDTEALDVVQEVFLYFLRKFPGFELTAQLKTFLYPAVKHTAIAGRQKSRRFTSPQSNTEDGEQDDYLEQLPAAPQPASGLADSDLATVMEALPAAQREVVLLRFVDGLTMDEIAEALEIPSGTVKSRLHHALRRLRDDPGTRKYFLDP